MVDEVDHLRHRHKAVGLVSRIAKRRQPALPVGCQQCQRVSALVAPRIGNITTFENQVVNRAFREAVTDRQSPMPGTYYDYVSMTGTRLSTEPAHLV